MRTRKMRLTTIVVLLVAIIPLTSCEDDDSDNPTGPSSTKTEVILPVPYSPQQTQLWCWAAASEMVLRYYGRTAYQCGILSAWYRTDCCTYSGYCVTGGSMEMIQTTLGAVGVGSQRVYGPVNFDVVRNELSNGRPIIIGYQGSFSGHVVVLYGYDAQGYVYINDPYYGQFRGVPFGATFTYNGQLRWAETLVSIR